jgi:hypothetical protein
LIDFEEAQSPVFHQGRRGTCTGCAIAAGHDWVGRKVWQEPDSILEAPPGENVPGKHAVLVVGATEEGEGVEALKIKNSWGHNWGQGGYALLSRPYLDAYGICAHVIGGNK